MLLQEQPHHLLMRPRQHLLLVHTMIISIIVTATPPSAGSASYAHLVHIPTALPVLSENTKDNIPAHTQRCRSQVYSFSVGVAIFPKDKVGVVRVSIVRV